MDNDNILYWTDKEKADKSIAEAMEKTDFDVSVWKSIKEAVKELIENLWKKFSSKFGKKGKTCEEDKK